MNNGSSQGDAAADRLSRQQRRALERSRRKMARRGASPAGKILASGAALTLGVGIGLGSPAEAATFNVSNLADSGAGSLRQAIVDANAAPGPDVITFQAGLSGTITLTSGQLAISDSVNVQGPGQAVLTVNANNASRVFYVYASPAIPIDVTISGLTITGGNASRGGGIADKGENLVLDHVTVNTNKAAGEGGQGGGLWVDGTANSLKITNSVFSGNTAVQGGGIFLNDSGQPVLIQDTVISGNQATGGITSKGGGIYLYGPKYNVTIERSTISGNQATGSGGGIYLYHTNGSTLTIRQSTLSGNSATTGGGASFHKANDPIVLENSTVSGNQTTGSGGGLFFYQVYTGSDIRNSTIAGNTAGAKGGGIFLNKDLLPLENTIVGANTAATDNDISGGGTFSLSFDLVKTQGGANVNDNGGNIFNQDPQLGPLGNHGGPTQTRLPAATSPAINAGDPTFGGTPATDQRGFPRVVGGRIDIGAVELNPGTVQFAIAAATVNETAGSISITVTRTGGDGAVSVSYATADGTAMAPGDYLPAAGMLNWPDQDKAPKSFLITIVNDNVPESDETFTVNLSTPQGGATLGVPATETVTIHDDDIPVAAVPTLGDAGKLLLAGLMGAAGLVLLRRRRKLAAPVVAISLAIAGAAGANAAEGTLNVEAVLLSQVQLAGLTATLHLSDGSTVAVPLGEVEVRDRRHHSKAVSLPLADVQAGQPAIVKVHHNTDGSIKRVRIALFDSLADAQAVLERQSHRQGK